jgi:hypothetical protein
MLFGCVIKEVTMVWTCGRGLDGGAERCIENFGEKYP